MAHATCAKIPASVHDVSLLQQVKSPQEEIAQIYEKTRELGKLIESLQEEKDTLLRRLNDLQSPIMCLPLEVLSTIFELVCRPRPLVKEYRSFCGIGDKGLDHFQLTLASVCSHWRQVAHTTPCLWTSIALNIASHNEHKRAALLQLYLSLTKFASLTLALQFSPNSPIEGTLVHSSVDHLVIQNLPRVRELLLVKGSRAWLEHLPSLSQLVSCSLDLDHPRDHRERETLTLSENSPLLHLYIHDMKRRKLLTVHASWSLVTSLSLSEIQVGPAVEMLLHCPNVVSFHFWNASSSQSDGLPVTLTSPVTFHHLEVFDWTAPSCAWSNALIKFIHLPALRELKTNFANSFPLPDLNEVKMFFNRIPSTLTKAHLDYMSLSFLPNVSNIEDLHAHFPRIHHLKVFFEQLVSEDDPLNGFVRIWPKLKKLQVWNLSQSDWAASPPGTERECGHSFLNSMQQRSKNGESSFHFHTLWRPINWTPEVQEGLKTLVQGGFSLQITQGSACSEVDWLRA